MYAEALAYLRCLACPDTRLDVNGDLQRDSDGAIRQGTLHCRSCRSRYPIRDGIVDMLRGAAVSYTPAQITNYLPPTAWAYERTWRPRALSLLTGEPFGYERELPLIVELLAPQRGGLYVDIACSNGLYARAIARTLGEQPGHVIGIDHSRPMLQQARRFAQQHGLRISYVRAQAQRLPFAAEQAAGLAMGGSLNEIGDQDASLREARRILAPTGRFAMMNLVRAEHLAGRALQGALSSSGLRFWSLEQLNRHLETSGLRLVAQWRYRVVVFSLLLPRLAQHVPPDQG
jgi:SAM-dependent methyltransferase